MPGHPSASHPKRGGYVSPATVTSKSSNKPPDEVRTVDEGISSTSIAVLDLRDVFAKFPPPNESRLEDVKTVASYCWARNENKTPTIVVPGCPPIWTNKLTPFKLSPDEAPQVIDGHAFHCPSYPLAPLILAVDHLNPSHPLGEYDVIADRSTLCKLLGWIEKPTTTKRGSEFRIDIDVVGEKTIVFQRWEARIKGFDGTAFVSGFEHATTDKPVGFRDTTDYQRVVSYDLNGLRVLMRFGVNACLLDSAPTPTPAPKAQSGDDLTAAKGGLKISGNPPGPTSSKQSIISIRNGGHQVAHHQLLEITARSASSFSQLDWKKQFFQLYLSQTPRFYLAVHKDGEFSAIHKYELGQGKLYMRGGESLKRLPSILRAIAEMAVGEKRKMSLVFRGGVLSVHERIDEKSLDLIPSELRDLFALRSGEHEGVN